MASEKQTIDGSSIVEMEIIGDDHSDYEVDLSGPTHGTTAGRLRHAQDNDSEEELDFMKVSKSQMASGVASFMWEEGRQRATKAFNVYGNIDILRPYFDVEPHTVRNRLIHSLVPKLPRIGSQEKVPRELYGPTMVVLTLIALLLFQMKSSGHTVQEGTLMGSAFGVCFTYWFGVSSLVWFLSYMCSTHIASLQILSLLGYGMFGHCVALFLSTTLHSTHSHFFFYMVWLIFGGLSTLRIISILYSRTTGQTQRMIVCGAVAIIHMLFLLYLHFAYHQIVEDIDYAIDGAPVVPQPGGPIHDAYINEGRDALEGAAVPDQAEAAAKTVTESVKRVIRAANVSKVPTLAVPVKKQAHLIIDALKPQIANMSSFNLDNVQNGVQQALNGTRDILHQVVNGTV